MVTRIRKGARPHIYLREWRKKKNLRAIDMAERLEIERESYYRLEREPKRINLEEMVELADRLGIEPEQLFSPPDAPESVDAMIRRVPAEQREMVVDVVKRLVGRAS